MTGFDTPPPVKERYTQDDLGVLGFHDCRIWGVRWNQANFEVVFDLDYIVTWVKPSPGEQGYRFWVSPAELRFFQVCDLRLDLAWINSPLECSIQDLHRGDSRTTPNGTVQWHWRIELSEPEGAMDLGATSFELKMKSPPILSDTQAIRRGGGELPEHG